MTGILQTVNGADFSAVAKDFVAPVKTGLLYWNYFLPGQTTRNLLRTGGSGVLSGGSPAQGAGFVTFTGSQYLDTGISDMGTETLIVVARYPTPVASDTANGAIGAYGVSAINSSRTTAGTSIALNNSTQTLIELYHYRYNTGDSSAVTDNHVLTGNAHTTWAFLAVAVNDTSTYFADLTNNSTFINSYTNQPADPTVNTIKVGKCNLLTTNVDVAMAAVYSGALSGSQLASIYAAVKTYLATQSISI